VLTQHAYDLILGKTASPHRSSPSDELTYQWHDFRGARQVVVRFIKGKEISASFQPNEQLRSANIFHRV
jgi:hypothetical protein